MVKIKLPRGVWQYDSSKVFGDSGGFGTVYEGVGISGEKVAIKKLHGYAAESAQREIEIADELIGKQINNVIPVFDAGKDADSDVYYVVMSVASGNLGEKITKNGKIPESETRDILKQIINGLLSIQKIVHRDLKPENILYFNGAWCVADFGIARFVEEVTSARTLKRCHSPYFAAPEQWRFERTTAATDVYSLGCIVFNMMEGKTPFEGSEEDLYEQHLHLNPSISESWSGQMQMLISMMMRKNPETRPTLQRVKVILDNIPAEKTYVKLASAAAAYENKVSEEEAKRQKAIVEEEKRVGAANSAREELKSICAKMAEKMSKAVASVNVNVQPNRSIISLGDAYLILEFGDGTQIIPKDAFRHVGWDVIYGGGIGAMYKNQYRKSSSLWYANVPKLGGGYRWYEAAYKGIYNLKNPPTYQPYAADYRLLNAPLLPGHGRIELAYGPKPIDDEDINDFCERWADILGECCLGN